MNGPIDGRSGSADNHFSKSVSQGVHVRLEVEDHAGRRDLLRFDCAIKRSKLPEKQFARLPIRHPRHEIARFGRCELRWRSTLSGIAASWPGGRGATACDCAALASVAMTRRSEHDERADRLPKRQELFHDHKQTFYWSVHPNRTSRVKRCIRQSRDGPGHRAMAGGLTLAVAIGTLSRGARRMLTGLGCRGSGSTAAFVGS